MNMLQNMAQANEMRKKQAKYSAMLEEVKVTGQSKNAKVTVLVNGTQKVEKITIDPELIAFVYENFISKNQPDTMMSKAILEAIEDALSKLQMQIVKKMQENGGIGELMEMFQSMPGK